MGIVKYREAIDVTDYSKTDPNNKLPQSYKDAGLTLNTIYINGVRFDGISRESRLGWEEFVWSEDPTRNNLFAFENMDQLDVGLVAQCEINFKYCNIEDFKRFKEAIKQRYFYVTFFNMDTCEWEYHREMYCSKKDMKNLYYFNPRLLGVLDFSISLVATNRDRTEHDPVTITYHANGYQISVPTTPYTIQYGEQYYVDPPQSLANYEFVGWNTERDGTGWQYSAGDAFTAFKNTNLYAIYKAVV